MIKSFFNFTEDAKIVESADINEFVLKENSFLWKDIMSIVDVVTGIKGVTGFQINDFEPVDYIVEYEDGTATYVNLETKALKKFNSSREAYEYVMN